MDENQLLDRLVIGVDFGTTFSGVAEAYSAASPSPDDIHVIKTWPSGDNLTSDKVPSDITYSQRSLSRKRKHEDTPDDWSILLGRSATDRSSQPSESSCPDPDSEQSCSRWGFQVESQEPRLRCMKLLLESQADLPGFVSRREFREQLAESGKTAFAIVIDYLRHINLHSRAELVKRYGKTFVANTDISWVLSVPAIWSDVSKDAMLKAARRAGFGPALSLISEPEAAALYTLQSMQPKQLNVGDNYVVCDAGGGTVDLISYEIHSTNPLRLEESVEGSGACCGGAFLNEEFVCLVQRKMTAPAFATLCREKPKSWTSALLYFENFVKRNYDPARPRTFAVPFPGVADDFDAAIEDGFMTLDSSELAETFKPILSDIDRLVQGQINKLRAKGKHIAGLILVGGLGQSLCLFQYLNAQLSSTLELQDVEILQPANAWTAVARGAVLRGIQGQDLVISRMSRRNYGVITNRTYDPIIHPRQCKLWDEREERWKAKDRMNWYIRKGDTVSSSDPTELNYYFLSWHCKKVSIVCPLVVSDCDIAPDTFMPHVGSQTRVLCNLIVDLEKLPRRHWEQLYTGNGEPYYRVRFKLCMQIESGRINFYLRADGVVYGKVTAIFESY